VPSCKSRAASATRAAMTGFGVFMRRPKLMFSPTVMCG
jgi:hypothetical protein